MFFNNTLYVVVFLLTFIFFLSFYRVVVRAYGLIYLARIVCIEHCLYVNYVCITVCEELNDDDDDDSRAFTKKSSLKSLNATGMLYSTGSLRQFGPSPVCQSYLFCFCVFHLF